LNYVLREDDESEPIFTPHMNAGNSEGAGRKVLRWTPEQVLTPLLVPELGRIAERYFDISIEGPISICDIRIRRFELADAARMFKFS